MNRSADRQGCITQKISTRYGSHYCHVSFHGGCVTEIAFSSPGKFTDTALEDLLTALAAGVNSVIADAGAK